MGKRYAVVDGPDADGPLFEVEPLDDGTLRLHIPSPDPVIVSRRKAEEIRLALGAAIGDVP